MKKKILLVVMCSVMALSAVACGGAGANSGAVGTNDGAENGTETHDQIEVDKGLLEVVITIPKANVDEETTQETLDAKVAEDEGIKAAVLNEDGSVTYTMTRARQKQWLEEVDDKFRARLNAWPSDEGTLFTKLEANKDFTKITVTTTASDMSELKLGDSIGLLGLYVNAIYYNRLAGEDDVTIRVIVKNEETGEELYNRTNKEVAEAMKDNNSTEE